DLVDGIEVPRHHGPVDRLIRPFISRMDELRGRIEQAAKARKIAIPEGRDDRRVVGLRAIGSAGQCALKEPLHLYVAAIVRELRERAWAPTVHDIRAVRDQK